MTQFQSLAPYHVLIVDDAEETTDFGPMTKKLLEAMGCIPLHVISIEEAIDALKKNYFDVLVIDINLGSGKEKDGFKLQKTLRDTGQAHPIIMVTGQPEELERPIKEYADVFATGATLFYEKTKGNFRYVFVDAIKHIDPIRRALYLLMNQGYSDTPLHFDGKDYRIKDLLINDGKNEDILRQLRDSFYELFIEMWKDGDIK